VEENEATVRAVEEAWDSQDLDALDQYFADDFDNATSGMPGLPGGLAGSKMAHQGVMQAFPDRKVAIEEILGEGDAVAVRTRVTGTNQGGFLGTPANGNPFDIAAVSIYRFRDGKIVSHWGLNDGMTLMMQLQGGSA
jgi:steroid delta-isomerase-like uncharacterized protein